MSDEEKLKEAQKRLNKMADLILKIGLGFIGIGICIYIFINPMSLLRALGLI